MYSLSIFNYLGAKLQKKIIRARKLTIFLKKHKQKLRDTLIEGCLAGFVILLATI